MNSEIAIDMGAPPDLVFALAHDVERWSTLLPHYVRSRFEDTDGWGRPIFEFVARRPLVPVLGLGLPVAWWSRTWNEPEAHRLYFEHIAGATRGMMVTWRMEPTGDGTSCRVTIAHEFSPRVPGFARFVDRFFTKPIAGCTLATFKALAEAVVGATAAPTSAATSAPSAATSGPTSAATSAAPPPTNPST
jgi:ribosome-associated toxin RatA of RatAB toxin-antitoxin module